LRYNINQLSVEGTGLIKWAMRYVSELRICILTLSSLVVNICPRYLNRELGCSVSIVSGYWLDDLVIGVRSSTEAKDFSSSLCVQTGSGAYPASSPMGTWGSFPWG